jgi:hypothetical protein
MKVMRDEGSGGSEREDHKIQQIDDEKLKLLLSVLKEAVAEAGIKDISEYRASLPAFAGMSSLRKPSKMSY